MTSIGSFAFQGCTGLTSVTIPEGVASIGYRAFSGCSGLTSVTSYIYNPFDIEEWTFDEEVYENAILFVPAGSIDAYQTSEGWKNFANILILSGGYSIAISLPEGINTQDYAKMYLELTNMESGQKLHYVLTDRTTYTFANIPSNTSWSITIRNERGDIFGQIDNVEVTEEDVSISFPSLSKPQAVVLAVLTPDGKNVTSQTQITWTDAEGNYLAQGASLTGLPIGYQTTYSVVLSQELAMTYVTPQPVDYVLTDGSNSITCRLDSIPVVQIAGKVKDAETGLPLSGAVVSITQTFGDKYTKTLSAKTDNKGVFTLEVANVPTSMTFAVTDYVSQTVNYDNGLDGLDGFVVPDVSLKPITGATISIDFAYITLDGETQEWYSDYQNVAFELFNVTKDCAVSQFNVQYPKIVLLEDVEDGDVLRLTATSRTNAFMPVDATATIAEQKAEASFSIKELGKIQATFVTTGNASVVGVLYDASGKLVKTDNYRNASLTIGDLADGQYTLVSMGSSQFFNTIYDLAQLPQTGLAVGTDYAQNTVEVKSGEVSYINISQVPTLDESKLYYTGTGTSFMVNKPTIVAGNYLTLTGHIDFKPAYASGVSNVQMIVDLPESCEFIENSVMLGSSASGYMVDGNRVIIPMADYTDRVRLCMIPTLGGDYAPSAFAKFKLNGQTITQPIGSVNYTVKDLSISVPSLVAKTTVPISGTAIGTSSIEIYDNDVLIGQATSLANGTWQTTCELNEPYNLSRHQIYAKVKTKQGLDLQSEMVECQYDMNAILVSKVHMLYEGSDLIFDFQNPEASKSGYYSFVPSRPEFTFTVDFTDNDPAKISNVIVYARTSDNIWTPMTATYNENKHCWVTSGKFNSSSLPVNVSVDFLADYDSELDLSPLDDLAADIQKQINEEDSLFNHGSKKLDNLIIKLYSGTLTAKEMQKQLDEIYEEIIVDDFGLDSHIYDELDNDLIRYLEGLNEEDRNREIESERIKRNHEQTEEFKDLYEQLTSPIDETIPSTNTSPLITVMTGEAILDTLNNTVNMVNSEWNVTPPESSTVYFSNEKGDKIEADMSDILPMPDDTDEAYREWGAQAQRLVSQNITTYVDIANTVTSAVQVLNYNEAARCMREINYNRILMEVKMSHEAPTGFLDFDSYKPFVDVIETERQNLRRVNTTHNVIRPVSNALSGLGALTGGWNIGSDIRNGLNVNEEWNKLIKTINECEDSDAPALAEKAQKHKEWIKKRYIGKGTADAATTGIGIAGAAAGPGTLGLSLVVLNGGCLLANLCTAHWENEFTRTNQQNWESVISQYRTLDCKKDDPDDDDNDYKNKKKKNGGDHKSNNKDKDFGIDPSGFVYEGVPSNRLQGVTATAYYKEMVEDMYGDEQENIVKWDASQYAQENPLFTDEYGFYRWDVPQGLWQVKFEKEGYETTYSDWLPVPPPQLDINIPMTQARQPEVKEAHAYEDGVEVSFDKYMMPASLTTDNILVSLNGENVEGTVKLLDEEESSDKGNVKFASHVRFVPETPFTSGEVTLFVHNRVKSYADVPMQDDYEQTLTIEKEVREILTDSLVKVLYGGTEIIVVQVRSAEAAAGKTLNVKTSSPMILSIEKENYVIDEDGQAAITVTGELPGTAALTFSVEGTDKTATTIVNVEQAAFATISAPKASIASGSEVERGTQITLSCETEGATIYYTLDGSCPCDENGSRMVYDGTPIVITEDVTIKVMAVAPDGAESEVVEFVYVVGTGIDELSVDDDVQVYPLPVHDKLNVTAGGKLIKSVTVSSTSGAVVAASGKPSAKVTLDVSHIPAGIYIVAVTTEKGSYSCKIVKEQ